MKKAISIAVLTALISGVFMLFGCSGVLVSGTYSNESEYFVGDGLVLQAVDSLEINWINGKVNVCYGLAREAIITESATRELSQSEVLRYGVFDGKLKVQFASSGHKFESGVVKNLTVVIPFEIKLKSLVINGVSAEIRTGRMPEQLRLDIQKHNSQYPPVAIVQTQNVHDRFLVVDDDVYHIGASLKDLGKKLFAFSKMCLSPDMLL